jgi:hypothetical protein
VIAAYYLGLKPGRGRLEALRQAQFVMLKRQGASRPIDLDELHLNRANRRTRPLCNLRERVRV